MTPLLKRKNSQEIVSMDEKKKNPQTSKSCVNEDLAKLKISTKQQTQRNPSIKNLFTSDDSCFNFADMSESTLSDTQQMQQPIISSNKTDINVRFLTMNWLLVIIEMFNFLSEFNHVYLY